MGRLLVTAAQMREMDRATIVDRGVPGLDLMEAAGRATAEAVRAGAGARVAVLCGPGNNGGDGFVAARWLRERGCDVRVWLVADEARVGGDARASLERWRAMGGAIEAGIDEERDGAWILGADARLDALLGTGLRSDVGGPIGAAIALLARTGPGGNVAADIVSGVDSDTGQVRGAAARADTTVTYGHAKRGHFLYPGAGLTGRLVVVDIGIPADVTAASDARCSTFDAPDCRPLLPARPADGHKGTFGHVLVVAGSPGKAGAALLTGLGALRSGAGLVTVASDEQTRRAAVAARPELMTTGDDPAAAVAGKSAVACGPGLGLDAGAVGRARWAAGPCPVPAVLDADALTILADGRLSDLSGAAAARILTPHPGEMARLVGCTAAEVQADRIGAAEALAAQVGAVVVLKGAHTVVADPTGRTTVNLSGGPGLATAGSGDVLTGVIAALLAQGLAAADAARAGVWLHGRAGDLASERLGDVAVLASDVAARIGRAWRS